MSTTVTEAVYGSWKSPIASSNVSGSSLGRTNLQIDCQPDKQDTVYWAENRASEGGRVVVCANTLGTRDVVFWTPSNYNARTNVHEYGGGAFFVYDKTLYFSNFNDGRMYFQQQANEDPRPLTPEGKWRYADGYYSHQNQHIYCVREDHSSGSLQEAVNTIVVIEPISQRQTILLEGADFYSHPRVSPDGTKLCWIQWNHPNMPWDLTELWEAELSPSGESLVEDSAKKIAENASIIMPNYDSNNKLFYISDKTNWWNLYHVTKSGEHINLLGLDEEIGHPHWQFGNEDYGLNARGGDDIVILRSGKLFLLNQSDGTSTELVTGYSSHSNVFYSSLGHVYCDAGSRNKLSAILRIHLRSKQVDVVRESLQQLVDPGYLSVPQKVTFPTSNGEIAHGYFYPPVNKDYVGPPGTLPPLLVKVHGGPTAHAMSRLTYGFQYFTSRGFAILDMDYRGSTGYGRAYRNKLYGKWGVCDIDDCCYGAQYVAKVGLVDGDKLCISGGSAGGYTTLACLTMRDVFKAGVSNFGIADLYALAKDCHKFESRYNINLVAELSDVETYKERSPLTHIDNLKHPVGFFHGSEDKVVPPNQAEKMYKVVKEKNIPTFLCMFEGEQHGFRKKENIQLALDGEFYFYSRVFGFDPADTHVKLDIDNLD